MKRALKGLTAVERFRLMSDNLERRYAVGFLHGEGYSAEVTKLCKKVWHSNLSLEEKRNLVNYIVK